VESARETLRSLSFTDLPALNAWYSHSLLRFAGGYSALWLVRFSMTM
jgi:hypothetical protein